MPRFAFAFSALLAASLFTTACTTSDDLPRSGEDLQTVLRETATRHHVCDVAVAVIHNRKLDFVDAASGCPPRSTADSNAVFKAASLGKPVFAYVVLQLVAEGRISLDAPIVRYLSRGYMHLFKPLNP